MTIRKRIDNSHPRTLREALYEVVHHSAVPAKVQAEELGISYSYLANAANPDMDSFDFQLRHILQLTRLTQNFAVLDFIEKSLGRVPILIPTATIGTAEIVEEFGKTSKEFGELAREIGSSLADGRIDPVEFVKLECEAWDLIRETVMLVEKLREKMDPGPQHGSKRILNSIKGD
jgi:hypothetical protein